MALAGFIRDGHGRRMTPSHAVKQQKRYRYYVSQIESHADMTTPAWRVSAPELESRALEEVKAAISEEMRHALSRGQMSGDAIQLLQGRCGASLEALTQTSLAALREQLLQLVKSVDLDEARLRITLSLDSIDEHLAGPDQRELAIAIVRNGRQAKIVIPPPASREQLPNSSLLKLVAQAFAARAEIDKGGSFQEVAGHLGCGREYLADLLRTSYLAPSIIQAILEGRQPADLSRKRLVQTNRIPLGWGEQEALFGFS